MNNREALGSNWQADGAEFVPPAPREEPLLAKARKLEATQRRLLAKLEQCLRNSAACLDKRRKNAGLNA